MVSLNATLLRCMGVSKIRCVEEEGKRLVCTCTHGTLVASDPATGCDSCFASQYMLNKQLHLASTQHAVGAAQASKATGALTLPKVLVMKDAGVDVSSFVSEELRSNLYSQEVRPHPRTGKEVGCGPDELPRNLVCASFPPFQGWVCRASSCAGKIEMSPRPSLTEAIGAQTTHAWPRFLYCQRSCP